MLGDKAWLTVTVNPKGVEWVEVRALCKPVKVYQTKNWKHHTEIENDLTQTVAAKFEVPYCLKYHCITLTLT